MGMNGTNEKRISKWPWHVGYERIAVDEDDMLCIYDADNVKIADMVGYTYDDDAHAMLMTAAPELREELGNRAAVALAVNHRRALSEIQRVERIDLQLGGGLADQRVLQHMAESILLRQVVSQLRELLDLQTGVGDEIAIVGAVDHLSDALDHITFFASHFVALAKSLVLILTPGVIVPEIVHEMM